MGELGKERAHEANYMMASKARIRSLNLCLNVIERHWKVQAEECMV